MSKEYELRIQGQPTRYSEESREFSIYFAEPDKGIREDTGILLFLAGYGGCASSKVYQKMRRVFADEYDIVTLQCDYLGYQYMQNGHHMPVTEEMIRKALSPREFRNIRQDFAGNREILQGRILTGYVELKESENDHNEMGLWQAMDNLMAIKVLMDIMQENGADIRRQKVIAYGQSHGAYLAYLCNRLAPGMIDVLIDNSAYLIPYYLHADREVMKEGELFSLRKLYHYLVADQDIDWEAYDLENLYQDCQSSVRLVVFHGADDEMIPLSDKKRFLQHFPRASLHEIGKEQVDGKVFRSTGHSLGADLLEMLRIAMGEIDTAEDMEKTKEATCAPVTLETAKYIYQTDWREGIPLLYWRKKTERAD